MNPWQYLRREIDGAMRSIRYDLSAKQSKRATGRDTVPPPATGRRPVAKDRRRFYAAAAAVLLPVAGVSGYFAVTSGLDALFPGEGAPNRLPESNPGLKTPGPSPDATAGIQEVGDPARGRPAPRTSPVDPVFSPPVPTPAPTCQCTPPPPPPTPTPTPTMAPSTDPTMAPSTDPTMMPMPTPAPTRSGWQRRSPSPLPTSRLRP